MGNSRALMFFALAVVAASLAILLIRQGQGQPEGLANVAAAPVVETEPVVVASQDIPAGAAILAGQVNVVEWPKAYLPAGKFGAPREVDRRVLKRAVQKGEPILDSVLLPMGAEAGLSALIAENHRAMSVKVDAVVGVAGFVKPGSRVDVIATIRSEDRGRPFTRVILQDLKVLAIDQKLEESQDGAPQVVSVVTLEVAPNEAQRLGYAASEGALQLALRNPTDAKVEPLQSISSRDLLPVPKRRSKPRPKAQIETIRGSNVTRKAL